MIGDITINLPQRAKIYNRTNIVNKPLPFADLFATSQHLLYYSAEGTRIRCIRCQSQVSLKPALARKWLSQSCIAIGTDRDKPIPIFQEVTIGTQKVDRSHKLFVYKGLIFCNTCGAYSGTGRKVDYLSFPCEPPKRWGKDNKADIWANKLPQGLKQAGWPCSLPKNKQPEYNYD